MNNQRGEVVTGVMVAIMVGMMIFGMFSMHGGKGDHKEDIKSDQQGHSHGGQGDHKEDTKSDQQGHSKTGQHKMHH